MQRNHLALAGAAIGVAAVVGGVLISSGRTRGAGNGDDAPGRTARRQRFGDHRVTGKTVLIAKPDRQQLYDFWRDFSNLPAIMDNLDSVERIDGDRSRWRIKAPAGGTVDVETIIAQDRPGELIAWRSTESSQIETEGRVAFRDAPEGRGTLVELVIAYQPPLGRIGQAVASLLQREPAIQARRDLRRFKMLMETGEIATADNRLKLEEAA
jgi:uncharacterized membrane protein